MKLKIYLDTSILSCLLDERTPERMAETKAFWARLSYFESFTSELTQEELLATPEMKKRKQLVGLLKDLEILLVTDDARELARRYVEHQVFTPKVFNDALHVAIAVQSNQNLIVSWNFKHLVNRTRRARINALNASLGLPPIEIASPLELQE